MNSNVFLNELSTVRQTSYTSRATGRDDERSTKSAVVVPEGSHVKENKAPVALISPAAVCRIIKARWGHVPLLWTTWFRSSALLHFSYRCGDTALFFETLWMSRYRKWMDYGLVCSRSSHRGKDSPESGKRASLSVGQVTRSVLTNPGSNRLRQC